MGHMVRFSLAQVYLAFTPSGELLQVWRMADHIDIPIKSCLNRQGIGRHVLDDRIHFANEKMLATSTLVKRETIMKKMSSVKQTVMMNNKLTKSAQLSS